MCRLSSGRSTDLRPGDAEPLDDLVILELLDTPEESLRRVTRWLPLSRSSSSSMSGSMKVFSGSRLRRSGSSFSSSTSSKASSSDHSPGIESRSSWSWSSSKYVKLVVESARDRRWEKTLLALGTLSPIGPEKIYAHSASQWSRAFGFVGSGALTSSCAISTSPPKLDLHDVRHMAPPVRRILPHTGCSWKGGDTWRSASSAMPRRRGRPKAACCCGLTRNPCWLFVAETWSLYIVQSSTLLEKQK